MINSGDILFQLFALGVLAFIIIFIISLFKNGKKRRDQLDRIETKLNEMSASSDQKNP